MLDLSHLERIDMADRTISSHVIEALRKGIPPQRGVELYSVGHERLIEGIEKYHLTGINNHGIIRFTSGSWGAGKTHFFRLLRDVVFKHQCLVANVELNVGSAALNKFESIFYSIVRNIRTPDAVTSEPQAAPFRNVVRESLLFLGIGDRNYSGDIASEHFVKAKATLMADHMIDIDFKKMILRYWETYLPDAADPAIVDQTRDEILQWFSGEGSIGMYRKVFGVNKIVNKDNAKIMLQSLAGFVILTGYKGLVILFDEAEQSYSVMRKSALRDAHNNLLSLINNVEALPGLFLIYATTPDFYTDPKHGIVIYGALAGRIGKPEERSPRALSTIWNLDAIVTTLVEYQDAAKKIHKIYAEAYSDSETKLPSVDLIDGFVADLFRIHPSLSPVKFWRVLVTALVSHFDDVLEGDKRSTEQLYDDVMDKLRED
jgi:hypothetical protein